jgi:hypothetical protein
VAALIEELFAMLILTTESKIPGVVLRVIFQVTFGISGGPGCTGNDGSRDGNEEESKDAEDVEHRDMGWLVGKSECCVLGASGI